MTYKHTIALVALASVACSESPLPTATAENRETTNAASISLAAVADALHRITPVLSDPSSAEPLRVALAQLHDALTLMDERAIAAAAALARARLDDYPVAGTDVADLAALRLALALVTARS